MKITVKKNMALLIAGLMLFVAAPLNANAVTQNIFGYKVSNGQASIVYCDKAVKGLVTIPDTLGGFPVTRIERDAFSDCRGLTSIAVPDSVTNIEDRAFRYCRFLKSIYVDAGNPNYSSENGVLFNKSKTKLIRCPSDKTGTSYLIPNSVTSIWGEAFYSCTEFTSITIPNSVTSIGEQAFYFCVALKKVTIPDSVTSIANRAFEYCTALKNVIIPDSVTSIGGSAFSECFKLKRFTIPNSVTNIGVGAFDSTAWYDKQHDGLIYAGLVAYEYKGLMPEDTTVVLKSGTKGIAGKAFHDCNGLTGITIPTSVTNIGDQAFYSCGGLKSIVIPASVTSIGDGAFHTCDALKGFNINAGNTAYASENGVLFNKSKTELIQYPRGKTVSSYTIPNSVKRIGDEAFSLCSGLTSVIIPNSVKGIGNWAFAYCSALKNVTIPNSVTSIGDSAFYRCTGLTSIIVPDSVKSISNGVFTFCSALRNINISESVTSIGDELFTYCDRLTNINVSKENKVYASENGVLFSHSKKDLIRYPEGKIGAYTIPNSVKNIGDWAFSYCEGLKSVIIPNSVTNIGDRAFDGCRELTSITIPNSVTSIGDSALTVTAWYDKQPDGLIYAGKVAYGYKGEMPANTAIVLKPGTKGIAEGAFGPETSEEDNPDLIDISIPNTVTNIGDQAFSGCTDLKNVTIPKSVVSIGEQAFGYWSSLDYVDKISGLTFSCFENSAGQRYAAENGFAYNILPASAANTESIATTINTATNIHGSTRTMSASTTVNDSTSAVAATTTSNGSTSTPATTTNSSSGTSNRVTVWTVILTMAAFLTVAVTAVLIIAKKKK